VGNVELCQYWGVRSDEKKSEGGKKRTGDEGEGQSVRTSGLRDIPSNCLPDALHGRR